MAHSEQCNNKNTQEEFDELQGVLWGRLRFPVQQHCLISEAQQEFLKYRG